MRVYCVSDLHCGDKGPRDNFNVGSRPRDFDKLLDLIDEEEAGLFILGDLFDWWQMNLGESLVAYTDMLTRFVNMGASWIPGNHDNLLVPADQSGMTMPCDFVEQCMEWGPFVKTVNGRDFLFMHGHEADEYCRDLNPGIGELTAIISGILEDKNKGPFKNGRAVEDGFVGTLEGLVSIWRGLIGQPGRLEEMINGVEKKRISDCADVVISGHTHVAGNIGTHHYNCGSWARTMNTFVRIEDDGSCGVWMWDGEKEAPVLNTLPT